MRLSAKTSAAMLIVLALAAFQFDSYSQSRGSSRGTSSSRTSSTSRSSSSSVSRSSSSTSRSASSRSTATVSRPSSSKTTSSGTKASPARSSSSSKDKVTRPSGGSSATVSRPSESRPTASSPAVSDRRKPDISPADRKPAGNVASGRPSGNPPAARPSGQNKPAAKPAQKPSGQHKPAPRPEPRPHKPAPNPDFRPGNHHKPVIVNRPGNHYEPVRVHPRDRDFMHYSKPKYHWSNSPHYYGYRIKVLPVKARRHLFGGITYYVYDDVWYRPYNGHYVVCRPPFGTSLAANLISNIAWTAVNIAYYSTVANTYDKISENNAYIAQQNQLIAQNNATIAAQNNMIAQSGVRAQEAYGVANQLGLVQSYASAATTYYYQDGVFYAQNTDGQYYVIVPPAGALVENLPEDFETVILNGEKYYRVDDTIYQMTINDGKPYFEVLGQMN